MPPSKGVDQTESLQLEGGVSAHEEDPDISNTQTAQGHEINAELPLTRATKLRLICAGYSFFCAGVNDGSLGPIIPYLLTSYHINTNFVSIVCV